VADVARITAQELVGSVATAESITVLGVSKDELIAPAPLTNAKIVSAGSAARRLAVPQTIEAARDQATRLAVAAGRGRSSPGSASTAATRRPPSTCRSR
jgi:hypothetical protein